MRIVVDTNVLVSGLLTPFGTCGQIMGLLISKAMTLCVDSRILAEYEQVLKEPEFDFNPEILNSAFFHIQNSSQVFTAIPLTHSLPHAGDNAFLEVAISAGAECLVTGNTRHFPRKLRAGVRVQSPAQFIEYYRSRGE